MTEHAALTVGQAPPYNRRMPARKIPECLKPFAVYIHLPRYPVCKRAPAGKSRQVAAPRLSPFVLCFQSCSAAILKERPMPFAETTRLPPHAPSLFQRLPEQIFSPLASANRRQYWHLLCALYDKRFGPDAP